MKCTNCAKTLSEDATFCGGCGTKQNQMTISSNKTKIVLIVAFLIATILFKLTLNTEFKIESGSIVDYRGEDIAVVTPTNATEIGEWAFSDKRFIKTVTINDSVEKIGTGAFEGCTTLTMVTIPETVTDIGDWIFAECWSLRTVCVKAGSYADAWARNYDFHSTVTIEYY